MSFPPTDYLAAEAGIVARLEEVLIDAELPGVKVWTAANFPETDEDSQPVPRIDVIYDGDRNIESSPGGASIEQLWNIVIAVRNVAASTSAKAARATAGPLAVVVCRGLYDFSPGYGLAKLRQASSPYRATLSGWRYYLPLAFTTHFSLRR